MTGATTATNRWRVFSSNSSSSGTTVADPSATIGLSAVNGSATTALRSDGAPALSQAIAPTWTGVHTFTPAARSSGVAPAFQFNTPADTGTTASTERIEFSVPGAIVTWATGALTTQRFNVFGADTIAFAGASTVTTAVGNDWSSPVAGTNATLTNSVAGRFNASSAAHIPVVMQLAASQTGNAQEVRKSDGTILARIDNQGSIFINNGNGGSQYSFNTTSTGLWFSAASVLDMFRGDAAGFGNTDGFIRAANFLVLRGTTGGVLISQGGTGVFAGIVKGIASRTAPLLQLQTSAGSSLGNVGGCIFDSFGDASTTSTDGTEDDLFSYTTVANSLAINGDKIVFRFAINTAAHATATRKAKVYFAGTAIYDSTALATVAADTIIITGEIFRESSTVVRCDVMARDSGALGFTSAQYTRITSLTLTGTNILKITGAAATGASSGDIAGKTGTVSVIPAGS